MPTPALSTLVADGEMATLGGPSVSVPSANALEAEIAALSTSAPASRNRFIFKVLPPPVEATRRSTSFTPAFARLGYRRAHSLPRPDPTRSEERRVGKGCRARGGASV